MDIDNKGMPNQVNIVKNLRFPDTNISSVIGQDDLPQIGKLQEIVNPSDYGVNIVKI